MNVRYDMMTRWMCEMINVTLWKNVILWIKFAVEISSDILYIVTDSVTEDGKANSIKLEMFQFYGQIRKSNRCSH